MAARKNRIPVVLEEYLDGFGSAKMPIRAHSDDAGFDLFVARETVIPPHGFADVPSGVHIQLPNGYWGMLTGRSSTIRKRGLLVVQGIIDTGYTGELFSAVWNLTDKSVIVEEGDRIAQLIILPNSTANSVLARTDGLGATTRGGAGFGSSGR
ncbi:deoxyuridine triphosphatase [Microbacterium phage Typher]|nr:deoxyuridine triphosphatase [Microbacterium phage Typher]